MTMDSESSAGDTGLPEQVDEAAQAAEGIREAAAEQAASAAIQTSEAVAEAAHDVNQEAAETVSVVSRETAQAFDAARDRLKTMADADPLGIQRFFGQIKVPEAFGGTEGRYRTAAEGLVAFNTKAIEAWRSNAEAAILHWRHLAAAKSLSEAIALNAEHTRRQMEAVGTQTRELSALAGKIAAEAVSTLKFPGR